VIIPKGVTRVEDDTFDFCGTLARVTIPDSVTYIGNGAFAYCACLTSVVVGNGVVNIGNYSFYSCFSLTAIVFRGNAPSYGPNDFSGDGNAIAYYLPGTTGWGTTFGGTLFGGIIWGAIPAALWNPQMQISNDYGGSHGLGFGFNINGGSGLIVVVEACTNIANPMWQPIQTNTLTGGAFYFNDPQWANHPSRFYRLCSP
jgi:hypothetical protein